MTAVITAILSLAQGSAGVWASGPEGLWLHRNDGAETVLQPQAQLYCSAAVDDLMLVGGLPHGVTLSTDAGAHWQSADLDGVSDAVVCFAPDPRYTESGVILAGTESSGVLRSQDRGRHWTLCNFGLESFAVLGLAWTPPAETGRWPAWEVAFVATEDGLYRSPNGGLGWRRCTQPPGDQSRGVFVTVAAARDFQRSGLVLAGSESDGLWRSCDGGRTFTRCPNAPEQVNALLATPAGWLLGNTDGLYRSRDGETWRALPTVDHALTLLTVGDRVWIGTETGIEHLRLSDLFEDIEQ